MRERTGLRVEIPQSNEVAVRESDLIITVTTGSAVNVEYPWLKPGAFVARMGSHQEVALDVLLRADKLIVDRWEYASYRIPEMIELIESGQLSKSTIYCEWPEIAAGLRTGREDDGEIIVYMGLGIWGEYAAILPEVYRRARKLGLGIRLNLYEKSI